MQLFSAVSSAIATVVSLRTVTTGAGGATAARIPHILPYLPQKSSWSDDSHAALAPKKKNILSIKSNDNLPSGREERKEKNNNNDCVQNWSPTSVRKDEQSSRNKKLGSPTRWRSNKILCFPYPEKLQFTPYPYVGQWNPKNHYKFLQLTYALNNSIILDCQQ
jgi:hypothetical protein